MILFLTALAILIVAYITAISAKDLIRLLISLELMFASVFLAIVPLFALKPSTAYMVAILTIFTSSCELLILITAIILLDRIKRSIAIEAVSVGGERLD
ncbi:MAG: F420H(2):quinone oxidoreductase [Archaeoglobaceae archaeon]|nr:F420H(2):quinone oxidoreductase [Archaeoglobaceae archaeon]MCX8151928.1 F420H(2):quinone oxidoreductase [Archaeoglobaceae archaeon]MDW8013317.1 F420H(2):quinone oxidoreductase [Archaeoglobaceae archaeon]